MVIIDTTTVCLEVGERLVALGRYSEARELYIALYKVSAAAVPCEASYVILCIEAVAVRCVGLLRSSYLCIA